MGKKLQSDYDKKASNASNASNASKASKASNASKDGDFVCAKLTSRHGDALIVA
jgi:hypothetical protein